MISSNFLIGLPENFQDLCYVYPALVKEVIGNKDYAKYETALTINQEQIEDEFAEVPDMIGLTPFQYLMLNSMISEDFLQILIDSFRFFIKEDVAILPEMEMILIGKLEEDIDPRVDLDEPRILNEENFFEFQNMVRRSIGREEEEKPDPDESPMVKKIKAKGRLREKAKAKKNKPPTLGTNLTAICCMGIGISPLNIGEITFASVHYLIGMNQQREEYDTDIRSMLAGAKDVKLNYWIRNLD